MLTLSVKDALIREIETLPEQKQADVLTYVRFLKLGLADRDTLERDFAQALEQARALAAERQITPADIDAEIQAVREA